MGRRPGRSRGVGEGLHFSSNRGQHAGAKLRLVVVGRRRHVHDAGLRWAIRLRSSSARLGRRVHRGSSLDPLFAPRRLLSEYIEKAVVSDRALSPNPVGSARLDSLVQVLGGETKGPVGPAPELAQAISGRTFVFSENKMGLRRLALHFTPGAPEARLQFSVGLVAASMKLGLDEVFRVSEFYGQRWGVSW